MEIQFNEEEIRRRLAEKRAKKIGARDYRENNLFADPAAPLEHVLSHKVRAIIAARCPLYLVGPAGSGKSKCCELQAKALSLPFYCPPIGRETTNAQLFGYFNAQGEYVRTPIREACEKGGVLHLEEIDFASPAVGTALNALLANDIVGFPDIAVEKHADFVVVASANTFGTGANAQYIGSQGLNAATLDRFVFLDFPYDERLEHRLSSEKTWTTYVQKARLCVERMGLRHVISPRASIMGGRLASAKVFTFEEIEKMILFKGLDQITVDKIRAAIQSLP